MKNVKREFARLVSVLQAYALIATHVRILVTNQAGKNPARTTLLSTNAPATAYVRHADGAGAVPGTALPSTRPSTGASGSLASVLPVSSDTRVQAELAGLRDNVMAVFGSKVAEALEPLALEDEALGLTLAG